MEVKRFWENGKYQALMGALAVAGIVLAIIYGSFSDKKAELTFTVNSEARVLDIRQPVGGLEISYAGENLRTSKKSLWTMTITIQNTGNTAIKKGDYDDRAPVGIKVTGANIVERPVLQGSNSYLQEQARLSVGPDIVTWSPVILEPNDALKLSVLLLGPDNQRPSVEPIGKVADIRTVRLIAADDKPKETSLWMRIIGADSFWIQPLRAFVYFFIGFIGLMMTTIMLVLLFVGFPQYIKTKLAQARRRKLAREYHPASLSERVLKEVYVENGPVALQRMANVMQSIEQRNALKNLLANSLSAEKIERAIKAAYPVSAPSEAWNKLKDEGLLQGTGLGLHADENLAEALKAVAGFFHVDLSQQPEEDVRYVQMEDISP